MIRVAIVAALLGAACGDGIEQPGDEGRGLRNGIGDRVFLSTEVTDRDLIPGTRIRLTFRDDTLGVSAGCNSFGGRFHLENDRLAMDEVSGTDMGCDPNLHAQDDWLREVFTSRPVIRVSGDSLTITGGEGTIRFVDREIAEPDRPLIGTRWVVDTLERNSVASSAPQDVEMFVEFSPDGRVVGRDGCNGFGATYEQVDDRTLRIDDRTQTLIRCPDLVMEGAEFVASATSGTVTYEIDGDRLTLTGADDRGVSCVAMRQAGTGP